MRHISIIGIVLILFLACKTSKPTQTTSSTGRTNQAIDSSSHLIKDSLQYTKSIMDNKGKYINKEFGSLIKDLNIPIKSYSSDHIDRINDSGIMISFDDWQTTQNKAVGNTENNQPIRLFIEWTKPILRADVEAQLKQAGGAWRSEETVFYSKLIIKDIR